MGTPGAVGHKHLHQVRKCSYHLFDVSAKTVDFHTKDSATHAIRAGAKLQPNKRQHSNAPNTNRRAAVLRLPCYVGFTRRNATLMALSIQKHQFALFAHTFHLP